MNDINLVKKTPIWRFYYKGSHSHPVRKVVAIIERTGNVVTGYELRSGKSVYSTLETAPVKSYRLDKIAKIKSVDKRLPLRKSAKKSELELSTLRKSGILSVLTEGV